MAATPITFSTTKKHGNFSLSGGNLTATPAANNANIGAVATLGTRLPDTKLYFELSVDTAWSADGSSFVFFGLTDPDSRDTISDVPWWSSSANENRMPRAYFLKQHRTQNPIRYCDRTLTNPWGTLAGNVTNDVHQCAVNFTTGKIWFGANGTWFASGDPANDLNPACSGISTKALTPFLVLRKDSNTTTAAILTLNVGATAFTHTPPSGFIGVQDATFGWVVDKNIKAITHQHRGIVPPHFLGI